MLGLGVSTVVGYQRGMDVDKVDGGWNTEPF